MLILIVIMSSLKYSDFKLTNREVEEKQRQSNRNLEIRRKNIDEYVKKHNLIKLKSDYFSVDSYYYCPIIKCIWKVSTIGDPVPVFEISNDQHILQLNSITK